jgi:zinc protease
LARSFGSALTTGQTVEEVLAWPNDIDAVTSEQVKAAATHILDLDRSVTGILLPGDNPAAGVTPNPSALDTATQH